VILGERKVFVAVGGFLVILAAVAFAAVVIVRVATGHWLDVYYSPRLGPVLLISKLAGLAALLAAFVFGAAIQFSDARRRRREASPLDRDP